MGVQRSLPLRGAWIETLTGAFLTTISKSLPLRGAWIETRQKAPPSNATGRRSPCGGRGLKHRCAEHYPAACRVAPLAGGVD